MAADLDRIRELLSAERAETEQRIAALDRSVSTIVEGAQYTSTDDEHDPEGSTIAFERSQAGALLASAHAHLADIDAALGRLDDGTYGQCQSCAGQIGLERLEARPTARTCITCAARSSRRR